MRELIAEAGWEWYGRYDAVLGKVGQRIDDFRQSFALDYDDGRPYPLALLARDLGTTEKRLSDFCRFLSSRSLIDPEAWESESLIYVPNFKKVADDYTRKILRRSEQSSDQE